MSGGDVPVEPRCVDVEVLEASVSQTFLMGCTKRGRVISYQLQLGRIPIVRRWS
jgi:hypothetical protein